MAEKVLSVTLNITVPKNVAGAMVRKSLIGYPMNELDGELVGNITESGTVKDYNVKDGDIAYYTVFTYTEGGAYNRSHSTNRCKICVTKRSYFYGYDIKMDDKNPVTRVSYPDDVDNYGFAACKMSSDSFDYGDWKIAAGEKFMPRPCMLKNDGTVDYYLDPNDYSKKEDGTDSDVANTSYKGNAMMEWPKIWTKRWAEDGVYHFRCSDIQIDEKYDCWCNYDKNDKQIEYFYTPIYNGCVIDSVLRSLSGQAPSTGATASAEAVYVRSNGDAWYTEVAADWFLMQDLAVMLGKSTNTQAVFGNGVCDGTKINSGSMDAKGLFWGDVSGNAAGVKIFGMENCWGNINRRIAGLMCLDGEYKLKITRGMHDGSAEDDYNFDGTGYIETGIKMSNNGYASESMTTCYGRLAITTNGSATTYECDYTACEDGIKYARVGGNNGARSGLFYIDLTGGIESTSDDSGASISCKPN